MRRDDELMTAYVDGVSELTTEERRRVEELLANDPGLRTDEAATRLLLEQLRSLPPEVIEGRVAEAQRLRTLDPVVAFGVQRTGVVDQRRRGVDADRTNPFGLELTAEAALAAAHVQG